ncbi:30S ribosome-binding factor RbfA [[Mycoplasma] collis]|uniref:30S ribosome-binding factor RbfA n=1 Tax=[Mycoplasma] collis TaxID=2127 RepID=UPI00051C9CA8|nr:30S ribosome-binding factor RbfA [[Mycoplasma] collis]
MASVTNKKKENHFLITISEILQYDLEHSDVIDVNVTEVKLSKDGSFLKVYLTFLKREKKGLLAIENAKGFIKRLLAQKSNVRRVPELQFFIDDVPEQANKIEKILDQIKEKPQS